MAVKFVFAFCAQALFVQCVLSQCISNAIITDEYLSRLPIGPSSLSYPFPASYPAVTPTSGGGFAVTSSSPIYPTGVSVLSENAIEGALSVIGELPFLGAVALEGALPTAGAGGINYGCGNGNVAIVTEGLAPVGPAVGSYPGLGYGAGLPAGLAYGSGLPGMAYGGYGLGGVY